MKATLRWGLKVPASITEPSIVGVYRSKAEAELAQNERSQVVRVLVLE
jgi:hypothetical protein